ncbi:hypothetical protein K4K60_003731 [Colletotrichum sp. SAR11_57]|nr:hypothetical protein K4K60_003731 [Colletotrichum sp. SAR11_57]
MSSSDPPPRPPFSSLPLDPNGPPGNAWGLYGKDDRLGALNLLTPAIVAAAAASEIRTGDRVSLDWSLTNPSQPSFDRAPFESKLVNRAHPNGEKRTVNDDILHFNTQCSSQWDGFRHYDEGYQKAKRYYNNTTQDDLENPEKIGIDAWVEKGGIVGRGVLLDYASFCARHALPLDAFTSSDITLEHLKQVAAEQNVTFQSGDILLIRSGFTAGYNAKDDAAQKAVAARASPDFLGVEPTKDVLRWIWETGFAAVAGDAPSFERAPIAGPHTAVGGVWKGEAWEEEMQSGGLLHQWLLGGWGLPIGEMFDLEALSVKCEELGRWTFFLSSVPLRAEVPAMDLDSDEGSGVGIGIGSTGNIGNASSINVAASSSSTINGGNRRHSHSHHHQHVLDNHGHGHGQRHHSTSSINGNGTINGSSVNGNATNNTNGNNQQLASPPLTHPSNTTPLPDSGRRRRHRDKERVRVTRACDRCKKRKIRCTGIQPCELCIRTESHCTYNASYARGRQPPVATREDVARMDLDGLDVSVPPPAGTHGNSSNSSNSAGGAVSGSSGAAGEDALMASIVVDVGEPDVDHEHDHQQEESIMNGSNLVIGSVGPGTAEPPSRASPEPTQTDLQGHYVGPSSGVSFLLRVQKRLHQAVSFSQASSIFTFGDAPLPDFDPSGAFCVLLSKDEATTLLKRYFDFAVPTHRFLHRPTVEGWLEEFYATNGAMKSQEDAPARRAVLFMVFAQAQEYMVTTQTRENADVSARYFLAADHQLSKERGAVRLASVQARLCQCFWLLSQSRINHCWSLFGTVGHLALAIGLNRNRHADPAGAYNYIELECRRRTFWCAYSLDNYLSAALGRPRTFHDEDIDQELPSCSEDGDLHADHITPRMGRGQSLMLAPVAHVKLSRIVSMILRDLYSIRPSSFSNRCALAAKYSQNLKQWRAELSQFLDDGINMALLIPIFQRQRNVLNLAYWHAMILTHRPFLLSNFARLQRNGKSRRRSVPHKDQAGDSVQACLDAAMHVVDTVNDLIQAGQLFRAFWFTSYFAFSAVVVLYVYTIQQRTAPAETWQSYFAAATRCQTQLATLADNESQLAARYCLVLEELRTEALRQTERLHSPPVHNNQHGGGSPARAAVAGTEDVHNQQPDHLAGINFSDVANTEDFVGFDASPSSSLADMTSWGQFDSMVTSGFGGLEALLNDDSLRF